ncbi:MAG: SDR family oxidoreductase [Syntrophorhabdaceae bacterium]|nr:SDR family oxidoreductase [Syntrophorhabdaceae bacterium]
MSFEGQVVFITGGAKGLGKEMARAFLEEGAFVAVNDISDGAVDGFLKEFEGREAVALKGDVVNYEDVERVVQSIIDKWGRIDILINNAGIVNPLVPAEKIKKQDFDRVIDVNLKGAFYVTQAVGKKMIEKNRGRIVNIASQAGLFGEKGFLPYAISKSSLMLMTRVLAYEWSKYGITVCAIAPGFIAGGMNEPILKKKDLVEYLSKRTPIGRMLTVEEYINTIMFLASDKASYINGETIIMDGGMTGYIDMPLVDVIMKGR